MHTEYLIFYRREISLLRKKGTKWGKKKLGLLLLFSTLNQKKKISLNKLQNTWKNYYRTKLIE